jgi:hypothetical protein
MILPAKHLKLSESLLGLGSFVLLQIKNPKDIDGIWTEYQKAYTTRRYPAYHTFENLILAIIFLYSLGAIQIDDNGRLAKCV